MENILFVKYNSTRKSQYRIKTEIVYDGANKFVRKVVLHENACDHILNLADYVRKINDTYMNFKALVPEISEDGTSAKYAYIDGKSQEEILKQNLNDKDALINEMHVFLRNILELRSDKYIVFHKNADFISMFGDDEKWNVLEGMEATSVANIDMIPENFMLDETGLYCLDCEWVLEFPIPLEYIKYRSLLYFYRKFSKAIEAIMSTEEYWNSFGISEERLDIYDTMEQKFQEYIFGKNNSYRYTDRYIKKAYDFDTLMYRNGQYDIDCRRIVELQNENEDRNKHICNLDEHIKELDKSIQDKDRELGNCKERLEGIEYELEQDRKLIGAKDVHIRNIEAELNNKNTEILTLNHQINLKNNHIANIEYGYNKWMKFRNNPIFRCIRFPKWVAKKIYHRVKDGDGIERLVIPKFSEPKVSIVIPVYNQFDYTHACIKSIINTVKDLPYEIIIGDDMSTDATKKIKKYVSGIRVNINKTDHGFLMNCNRAAKLAKGDYIMFLNNDTQVHEEWLSSLVTLIESDNTIGMVGSKLVYPDGTLQEAGGIIWSDASGWNYGRNQNADEPEYNYVKEVDYVSGASIMIRTSLWNEIGGFDECFKPAYYEDTDLAFEVRKHGYKVMYQPKSVLTHFEGVSNGTDIEGAGLKSYQVVNQKKFAEKWNEELKKQSANPNSLFIARDRSQDKKIVLFIDHYVPHIDQDAGSKSTFSYIKVFLDMGYSVKFIGDNFFPHQPYTSILQQMGIEVLYGNWYYLNWKDWLQANGHYFDVVFANRPHITIKYIDILREYTNAKIIYYGHDLHHVREMREYEITGNEESLKSSKYWKNIEYDIMDKADVIYYPSYVEINKIVSEHPEYKDHARAIPVYMYEKPHDFELIPAKEKKDIMFVGGFGHKPNIDAACWFVNEILPKILKKYPNLVFHIIGSKPTDEVKALASDNVIVHGFVSDEDLIDFYHNTRMAVVPLRYGAGMKGKVVESLYYQIPLVTTDIGAEGMPEADSVMVIQNEADSIADAVVELYEDFTKLDEMSAKTKEYIEKYFSEKAAAAIVKESLKGV